MKIFKLFLLHSLLLSLMGCGDKYELEQRAFVVVLGIDKGENERFDITFQIANPQVGSTSQSQAQTEPPSDIVTIPASDPISAKDTVNAIVTRKIDFSHLGTIIIGSELAKTKDFDRVISSITRDRQVRRKTAVIVSKEKAAEFIENNKPKMETRPHKYYDLMQSRWKETGLVPYSIINRYFQRRENKPSTIFLAIYATAEKEPTKSKGYEDGYVAGQIEQKGGDPVQIIGSAVIQNGKMVDILTGEETRLSLFLRSSSLVKQLIATYPDPLKKGQRIAARVLKSDKTIIDINVKQEVPIIHVTVPLIYQLVSIPSGENYILDLRKQTILKESIENDLKKKGEELVKKTQEKYKNDPFKWTLEAKKKFLTIKAYEDYHWLEKYPNAKVHLTFKITIEDFGKQLQPPN